MIHAHAVAERNLKNVVGKNSPLKGVPIEGFHPGGGGVHALA